MTPRELNKKMYLVFQWAANYGKERIPEPIIGCDHGVIYMEEVINTEITFKSMEETWLTDDIYINENDYFGVLTLKEFKRYRKNDLMEDFSNIHPFVKGVIDNKERFLVETETIKEYVSFIQEQMTKPVMEGIKPKEIIEILD